MSIFKYLAYHQQENGAIFDSNIQSTLNGQYHHTNFSLSGLLMYLLTSDEAYCTRSYNALKYFVEVPLHDKAGGIDFNNFPILILYALINNTELEIDSSLIKLVEHYIENMSNHASLVKGTTYGNNFVALRAVNQLLRYNLLGRQEDIDTSERLMEATLKWQLNDGVFYDFPREFNDPQGIPSLTYHSKITLMVLLYGLLSKENHIINRAIKGLEVLTALMAEDGEAFYYGRTNNALYGYACGIFAFRLAANFIECNSLKDVFGQCEDSLFNYCSGNMNSDGHLSIVPNRLEKERCGFDNYMYVTVYNAFTMTMLLLSSIVEKSACSIHNHNCSPEASYFAESGFMVYKGKKLSTAFGLKGHNYYQQYKLDPRFSCCTPLFLKFNGHDILPTIPFSAPVSSKRKYQSFPVKFVSRLKKVFNEFRSWGYLDNFNPLHAGFLPYIETTNEWLMPLCVDAVTISNDNKFQKIYVQGRFVAIKRKGFIPALLFICNFLTNKINVPVEKLQNMMIKMTDSFFEREILIHDNFIHFKDKIKRSCSDRICFGLRTYSDALIKVENAQLIFKKTGCGFLFLLDNNEVLRSSKQLCSSKGMTTYWDFIADNHKDKLENIDGETILQHTLILFDENNDLKKIRTKFDAVFV
ncbi:MAG: hypothetical protein HF978_04620 [Desulfobacteraceae bacterium]|nr:hypothetical protein [Desulfobacteraceae bacterium]MBC2754813.1 hypothetical protein [Desulfobacteraceae bacterium]